MKKTLLCFLLFIFHCSLSYGQFNTYYPFPDSNAYWSERTYAYVPDNNGGYTVNNFFDYYLKGDTTINSVSYHKLRVSGGYSLVDYMPPYNWSSYDSPEGFIREDTAKHVYYRPVSGGSDTLLYDFNLKQGDFLPVGWNNRLQDSNYVKGIDSVRIGKAYRRQFLITSKMDAGFVFDSIIEGIGSTSGLLELMNTSPDHGFSLNCFSQNGKTLYPDTTTSCQFFYLGVNNINKVQAEFTVYPNPSGGAFTLKVNSDKRIVNSTVEVYNMLGQMVYSKQFSIVNSPLSINLSSQPAGIYLYRITDATGKLLKGGKLVIMH